MNARHLRGLAAVAASAAVAFSSTLPADAFAATPAERAPLSAKPHGRPGQVAGLALSITKPAAKYRVAATWQALAGATKYAVVMTDPTGAKIAGGTVTSPAWAGTTTLPAHTNVKVTVTPYVGTRRGRSTSITKQLPDVTAPTAVYSVHPGKNSWTILLGRDQISDDTYTASQLTETISWGDGSDPELFPVASSSRSHTYPTGPAVYYGSVRVHDPEDNNAVVPFTVALGDTGAPTGTAAVSQSSAFARWTRVAVSSEVSDDLSTPDHVSRSVDWGDGSVTVSSATAASTHVYAAAGSYTPSVTFSDEAGNVTTPVHTDTVLVVADTFGPQTTVVSPAKVTSVRAWSKVRGTVNDAPGVGAKVVKVKLVEKRGTRWYAYLPGRGVWAKAGTKAAALRKAGVAQVRPVGTGWTLPVKRLARGTLVVRAKGIDNLGNASAWKVRSQALTRR